MGIRNLLMVLSLAISVCIGLVLARGGNSTGANSFAVKELSIGLSMDSLKEARWQVDRDVIVARCKEQGIRVQVQAANSDDAQQIRDVESLLTSGVRMLILIPHDAVAMAKAVEMAHKVGVPVISYDRVVRDCEPDLAVLFDNVRVGELQARFLVDHLPTPGKGKIVRIYGAKTDNNSRQFKDGQDHILEPYIRSGDIQVVHEDWAEDWKPENAKKIMNAAITRLGHGFDAVLASNDGTAGGAIQALTEEGLAGKVLVTGQDAELAACQRIVDGTQTMSVYKPLSELATDAADAAARMARGRPVIARDVVNNGKIDVPTILVNVVALTRDNMLLTVVHDGFHSYDDVYRGVPADRRPPRP
jgi:D-xylose transport system substrate-binding protein